MNQNDVAVAIINYNTKDWLRTCLKSVLRAPPLAAFEIIVVDNGSSDGSIAMVADEFPNVHLIENAGNLGYAAAANQALRTSHAKYVLVLNTDIEVDPEAIDILVEHADRFEDLGVGGPLLLNSDGSIQMSGRRFPSFIDATIHAFLGLLWPRNPFSVRYLMMDWDRKSDRNIDWISGAAMIIRREAAEKINFFDEQFFMYVEDMDFCHRLKRAGWKTYFLPDAKMVHHLAKTSEKSSALMIIEFQRSLYRFYSKRYRGTWKNWLRPLVGLGLVFRGSGLILLDVIKRRLAAPAAPAGSAGNEEAKGSEHENHKVE